MGKIRLAARIVVALAILTSATIAHAPSLELDACHDDLDRLRETASDASDAAKSARSELDDFDDCRQDPTTYDLFRDGCRSSQRDYEWALEHLEGQMDDLDSQLHSVQSSCGYEFTINRMSSAEAAQHRLQAAQRRVCTALKRFITLGITPDVALKMCNVQMDGEWCKSCLGLK